MPRLNSPNTELKVVSMKFRKIISVVHGMLTGYIFNCGKLIILVVTVDVKISNLCNPSVSRTGVGEECI